MRQLGNDIAHKLPRIGAGLATVIGLILFLSDANATDSPASIRALRLSPDNARLAYTYCAKEDCEARIVDIQSGRLEHKFRAQDNRYFVDADFLDEQRIAIISGAVGKGLNPNQIGLKNLVTGQYSEITKSESVKRGVSIDSSGDILFAEVPVQELRSKGFRAASLSSISRIAIGSLLVTPVTAREIYDLYAISGTARGVLVSAYGTTNQSWMSLGHWRRSAFFIHQGKAFRAFEYPEDLIVSASASEDGNVIAFASVVNKRDKKQGNYIYDVFIHLNGENSFERITHDQKYVPEVRISRDGKMVAYLQKNGRALDGVISILNLESRSIKTITP